MRLLPKAPMQMKSVGEPTSSERVLEWASVNASPAGYNVVGIGDFTGNGTSDILWQEPDNRRRRRMTDQQWQVGRQHRSRLLDRRPKRYFAMLAWICLRCSAG
jgi:hypothetical protein